MGTRIITLVSGVILSLSVYAQGTDWYPSTNENKPFVRWWWHGSAVDKPGLSFNLEEFARAGLGGVEITPIYGVQNNESADIQFLSEKWMEMYKFTMAKAGMLGLQVDMNCGTGWPFGGPEITPEFAAKKMVEGDECISVAPTGQMVKRAAPGGEGFVLNHYDSLALKRYLAKFDEAFSKSGAPQPDTWFNDSYEVYGSDWTESLSGYFKEKYGYDIEEALLKYTGEMRCRALCDYRECLGEILRENFHEPWVRWAHSHGARVRNQSHGSPANILDLYAMVDIPETETYGRSDFNIPGLRQDPVTRHNDGDPSALKFAASAAHLTGRKYVSCETLTWMTEHFRTSLSQCKPEVDRAFCAGVNHIYFHGAAYSPYESEFPGWLFYAAINMSPTSSIWKDAPAFFKYIERCQSFLTAGDSDSDFLLYMPIYDAWSMDTEKAYMMFDIHGMNRTIPGLKKAMDAVTAAGFDADYISDKLLVECDVTKPVLVPECRYMPLETARTLLALKKKGVPVIFVGRLPEDVPGLSDLEARRKEFKRIVRQFGKSVSLEQALEGYNPEVFRTEFGGSMIRRVNEAGGYNYFLAMLDNRKVDGWVKLATTAASAVLFNPMDGTRGKAQLREAVDGCAEVRLQMEPGQSLIIKTFPVDVELHEDWKYVASEGETRIIDEAWSISFPDSEPAVPGNHYIGKPKSWTELDIPEAKVNSATASYISAIQMDVDPSSADGWILDLGDVRESASVYVNGEYVSTLWSVPFKVEIGGWLKPGINNLEVRVTNMDSNRIADMERRGVEWRIFKDTNINSITGSRTFSFGDWETDPAGLLSEVSLTPVYYDLPSSASVLEKIRLVNDYFTSKYPDPSTVMPFPSRAKAYESIIWTRAVYYEGLMNLYSVDPQQRYLDYTRAWGDFHDWGMRYGQTLTRNADNYCCSQTYIDMYRIFGEEKMIEKTRQCVSNIVSTPDSEGDWTWIDAIQMGMPVLVKSGEYEKAWQMYKWARDSFLNPEDGLWWRDKDFVAPYCEPNGEDCYWSRGNGWVYAALARVLEELPSGDSHRDVYISDFINMSNALLACQREDGLWNVSLHDPAYFGGPEATGTSLFAYGLAWGIRKGLLNDSCFNVALAKAWNGLVRICIHDNGFIGYSQGSAKEPKEAQPLSYDRIPDFEDFGTGCFLLAGSEIVKMLEASAPQPDPLFWREYRTSGQKPFEVNIPVPDGNYLVTVTLGDGRRSSETSILAESRRLCVMAEKTAAGECKTVSFLVNKRDRLIRVDGQVVDTVRTKSREDGKLNWDDELTLEILGPAPAVSSITVTPASDVKTIYLCGDSTVVDQDNEPWASWGQMAPFFLDDKVVVANYAESGERTDTFIGAGRLGKILSVVKPGDYIFVEFGHNDMKLKGPDKNGYGFFAEMLRKFISAAREKGAVPVLVTPTHRRNFNEEGRIVETHEDYAEGMKYVAERESVTMIDLHEMSGLFYETLGPENSTKAFVHYPAGAYPGMTNAVQDNTHFNTFGAFELARRVMESAKDLLPELASHICNTDAALVWYGSPYRNLAAQVAEKDDNATPINR